MIAADPPEATQWVVWNGSLGFLGMATVGRIENSEGGRSALLAPPYDVVGPFSLDELETLGQIAFGECLVMSRQRWQADQVGLRSEARERRRALLLSIEMGGEHEHRDALNLPVTGLLEPSQINAAFRRAAKTAHPDGGGSDAQYRSITEARDALLRRIGEHPAVSRR
jgi:hypothetical protein